MYVVRITDNITNVVKLTPFDTIQDALAVVTDLVAKEQESKDIVHTYEIIASEE